MAINSLNKQSDQFSSKYSTSSSKGSTPSNHLVKLRILTDGSITSNDSKGSKITKNKNSKSPYLSGDSVQLLSRVTEKKIITKNKKPADFVSSFPLAASIYRANSDEFKRQKTNKKVKKSVLTLPYAPTEFPQPCTVSDTNDLDTREYMPDLRPKKRIIKQNQKSRVRNKKYEFYDRDARYCSHMGIDLDCSSTDMFTQFTGDSKKNCGKFQNRKESVSDFSAHNLWTVLRNINRFQFRPSPPVSSDSVQTVKKRKTKKKRKNKRTDPRVIETCRTEEIAYISTFDVKSKSPMCSESSSFDRITVIDKQDEFSGTCKNIHENVMKIRNGKGKKCSSIGSERNYIARNNHMKNTTVMENEEQFDYSTQNGLHYINNNSPESLDAVNNSHIVDNPEDKNVTEINNIVEPTDFNNIGSQYKQSDGIRRPSCIKAPVEASKLGKDINDKLPKMLSNSSNQQLRGITKVIVEKDSKNTMLAKGMIDMQNRKPLIGKTIRVQVPSAAFMPKMTQTEIRRRLANMKFPIVILGKDQLCSTSIRLVNDEPPHLQGLDQQIWPFMQDWYDNKSARNDTELTRRQIGKQKPTVCKIKNQLEERKHLRNRNIVATNLQVVEKHKAYDGFFSENKRKTQQNQPVSFNGVARNKPRAPEITKPMHDLKDKMLKLLYKNTSAKIIDDQYKVSQRDSSTSCIQRFEIKPSNLANKTEVGTETETVTDVLIPPNELSNTKVAPSLQRKNIIYNKVNKPWAKTKWASNFIDTIIKKIRSGVYYNHENKHQHTNSNSNTDFKEVSIQTISENNLNVKEELIKGEVTHKESDNVSEIISHEADNHLGALPGFEENLPVLEIETLNMKEVAVKHCNTMVRFDIVSSSAPDPFMTIEKSVSFLPLTVTESQTHIFKSKTTIIHAILPAEICSLLPKIIRILMNSNTQRSLPLFTMPNQTDSSLDTIPEISNCESLNVFKSAVSLNIPLITPEISKLLKGYYFLKKNKKAVRQNNVEVLTFNYKEELLGKLSVQRLFPCCKDPISLNLRENKGKPITETNSSVNDINNRSTCTTLQLYKKSNFTLNTEYGKYTTALENSFKQRSIEIKISLNNSPLTLTLYDNNRIITTTITNLNFENTSLMINKFNFNFDKGCHKHFSEKNSNNVTLKAIEHKSSKQYDEIIPNTSNHVKARKNKYVKLYKKCKSTSNISKEKSCTPLSKIENLDDFLLALGTGKIFSSIFDGIIEKKILSSLSEMKNWITDISQRQAMLILLLTNKKDTANLIRFRPMLLQGIAVNRITRASELDMEIEVIETEHFNRFARLECIPYVTETVESNDNLMEELFWIAKTTASDYQKPFNEASERLLKSLLEKRKKLNPSYLRVMARYVGLGLLKSPNKN